MGRYDDISLPDGSTWQTKGLANGFLHYRLGQRVVPPDAPVQSFQIAVFSDSFVVGHDVGSYGTVIDGVLIEMPSEHDPGLPLLVDGEIAVPAEPD